MKYIRIGQTDRIELIIEDEDPVHAEVTPAGVYRVYYTYPADNNQVHTDLFVSTDNAAKTLTVMAMSGLSARPTWQVVLPVALEDEPFLLPFLGEEQLLPVREVDSTSHQLTLRHVIRMHYAEGMSLAKSGYYRAKMSDRRHRMHEVLDWLTAGWERHQLAIGTARTIRRVAPGPYHEPYFNTCEPLPDGWEREILTHRSRIVHMLDEYEMRTDLRPRPDDFWKNWHRGWDTDILPTLQLMAEPFGWTRVHNPREVPEKGLERR